MADLTPASLALATPLHAVERGLGQTQTDAVQSGVSVVIVSYNTVGLLRECIESIVRYGDGYVREVVVVDNASSDGSVEMVRREFPDSVVIANGDNVGFGAANNQGVVASTCEYVLLLNSDALLRPGCVEPLLRTLRERPDVGLVGPRLLNRDGSIQASAFRFPTPPVLLVEQLGLAKLAPWVRHGIGHWDDAARPVDWLLAACVLGRRDVLLSLGPFDTDFFMYSEDVDLCYRLRARGHEVRYVPEAEVTHLGGGTTRKYSERMLLQFVASEYLFYRKHYGTFSLLLAMLIFWMVPLGKWAKEAVYLLAATVRGDTERATQARDGLRVWPRLLSVRPPALPTRQRAPVAGDTPADVSEAPASGVNARGADEPKAARGSVVITASLVAISLLNYIFAITMGWLLSVEQFGRLGVMQSVLLLAATAVGAGFPWALTQTLSQHASQRVQRSAFRSALKGNLATGAVIALGLCAGALLLPHDESYRPLLLLVAATTLTLSVLAVFSAVLQGSLRLGALGSVRALEVVVKVVASVTLVALFPQTGAASALLGFFLGSIAATLVAAACMRGLWVWTARLGQPGMGPELAATDDTAGVYRNVMPFFIGVFAMTALVNLDIIGLRLFSPGETGERLAGHYQAAVTLARIPVFVVLALLTAVYPFAARHAAKPHRAHAYARLALKYTLCFIVPVNVALAVAAGPALHTLFSASFADSVVPLALAAAGSAPLVLVHAAAMLLQAAGRLRLAAVWLSAAVGVQLGTLLLLVPRYGTVGAALSLASAGLVATVALVPATLRTYGVAIHFGSLGRYALALASLALVLWVGPAGSRLATLGTFAAAGLVYLVALVAFGVLGEEDVHVAAGALGPQWSAHAAKLGQIVARLNLWPSRPRGSAAGGAVLADS